MKMLGDDEYLWSYTKGFAELPSPAQVCMHTLYDATCFSCLRHDFMEVACLWFQTNFLCGRGVNIFIRLIGVTVVVVLGLGC